jgi:hypothetical protein
VTKTNEYFEIEVLVKGTNKMRELILATCRAEALDKAKSKYRYIDAEIKLVPTKGQRLKLNRSSPDPKRRQHREEAQ